MTPTSEQEAELRREFHRQALAADLLPSPSELRRLRRARGLTLAEIGRGLGVSRQSVSIWELGQGAPHWTRIERYLELLGVLEPPSEELDNR